MDLSVFNTKKINIRIMPVETPYVCQYCKKKFAQEKTLTVHVCEKKRRHMNKDEKHVQMGFVTYNRFFQLSQQIKGSKTYDEFVNSQYYNAFVKFGSFLHNVNPLYPDKYIDYIVKSGIKLDHWCREEHYYKYVLDLIFRETAETALERSIKTMMDWAEDNNSVWSHYFKYVNTNKAVHDIRDGKMSPWLFLNCDTGKNMLQSFNDEQLLLIEHVIEPKQWIKKFATLPADVALVREIVNKANL